MPRRRDRPRLNGAMPAKDRIPVGPLGVRFLVEADDSNGSVTVFECDVPADARMPAPHSHDAFEETVYGLEGRTTYTVAGETIELDPGDSLCIRRGVVHAFANHGSGEARFLAIISPGVFGSAYFVEVAEVIAASAGGPPDLAAIGEVMRRHGLTPA
jgi:quercetin dioxygenase-like cupin family protein